MLRLAMLNDRDMKSNQAAQATHAEITQTRHSKLLAQSRVMFHFWSTFHAHPSC